MTEQRQLEKYERANGVNYLNGPFDPALQKSLETASKPVIENYVTRGKTIYKLA